MRAVGKKQVLRARVPSPMSKGRGVVRTPRRGLVRGADWRRSLAEVQAELKRLAKGRHVSDELIAERKRER